MAIESNLATKKCIADALFLSGSRASCLLQLCFFPIIHVSVKEIGDIAP